MSVVTSRRCVLGALPYVIVGLSLAVASSRALGQGGTLRAGSARVDITPTAPVALAGYASRNELSKGVHDPLSARVLAFEHEGRRLVLVSTDLIGFYGGSAEAIRKAILTTTHLDPSELFLTAIHTHSGPNVGIDEDRGKPSNIAYTKELGPKLASAVKEALGHLSPSRIGTASGSSPVGVNRRETVTDRSGKTRIVLGRNPGALTDREVQVLVVRPEQDDHPATVLFAYSTHSTSLGPQNYLISGDIHGIAEQFVEKYLGHGVIAPAFAGASGDIDPWVRVLPRFKSEEGWVPEPVLMGTMLGEEVVNVAGALKATSNAGPVKTSIKTLTLPGKPGREEGVTPSRPTRALNVTVGRVGDMAFVGLGCEAFNAIGRAIKTASPFPHTIVMTHCNGAAGYLPTRESYKDGGYEVDSSSFGPEAAEQVVKEVVSLLKSL